MKRSILLASAALVALTAVAADYTVSPSTSTVLEKGPVASVDYLVLSEGAINDFQKQGATVTDLGPNEETRFLYIWPSGDSLNPGDSSNPRVDMEEGGYVAFEVASLGWSGAGFFISDKANANLSNFNDNTRFHLAYMSQSGNGPASLAIIILDGDPINDVKCSNPAKFALGDAFDDSGAVYSSIGPKCSDDWQGIDISFADLKKIYPSFSINKKEGWIGNIMSFLGGGVTGQTFAFDAVYFYNQGESAVDTINNDAEGFVVTGKTVNALNGNGIELYGLDGKLVKTTNGSTLGIDNLSNGVYVVRCGSKTQKVIVK